MVADMHRAEIDVGDQRTQDAVRQRAGNHEFAGIDPGEPPVYDWRDLIRGTADPSLDDVFVPGDDRFEIHQRMNLAPRLAQRDQQVQRRGTRAVVGIEAADLARARHRAAQDTAVDDDPGADPVAEQDHHRGRTAPHQAADIIFGERRGVRVVLDPDPVADMLLEQCLQVDPAPRGEAVDRPPPVALAR